ncbi:hypothetical protein CES85_3702 (plasmid) [Ochrobactrum quorumnocens]|uniref:Uncharacterized protein n=1 Tax=Ochrobactrum quorumnocens TaxID=271865 RepID=A0A248UN91_9HYPH|nr:hypothetical protein CES85_3702 [[Ochrobactrum] quorumnocens]
MRAPTLSSDVLRLKHKAATDSISVGIKLVHMMLKRKGVIFA